MNTEKNFDVVNGPCKDLLFDACKYACRKEAEVIPKFSIAQYYIGDARDNTKRMAVYMPVKNFYIMGIDNEDGSGESWNVRGSVDADLDNRDSKHPDWTHYRFFMYYNSRRREGVITFKIGG